MADLFTDNFVLPYEIINKQIKTIVIIFMITNF